MPIHTCRDLLDNSHSPIVSNSDEEPNLCSPFLLSLSGHTQSFTWPPPFSCLWCPCMAEWVALKVNQSKLLIAFHKRSYTYYVTPLRVAAHAYIGVILALYHKSRFAHAYFMPNSHLGLRLIPMFIFFTNPHSLSPCL